MGGSLLGFALGLSTWACGAGGEVSGGETSESALCPECQAAGGETSDFGSIVEPTPCAKSEIGVPVDEVTAQELGFASTISLLNRSVEAPFVWQPAESSNFEPATGYTSPTSVWITTRVAELEHRVPQLAGCEDKLRITLDVAFETADGALAVSGQLVATTGRAASGSVEAFGRLDLFRARGSLRFVPASWVPAPRVGYLKLLLYFWPDLVRGGAVVEIMQAGTEEYDTRLGYEPLRAHFPDDDCQTFERPLAVEARSGSLAERSVLDVCDEASARLAALQPSVGVWQRGEQTSVSVVLGTPSSGCESTRGVGFEVPLSIRTTDGRVQIDRTARGWSGHDVTGQDRHSQFYIYGGDSIPAAVFAERTGISGVSFGGLPAAVWEATLSVPKADSSPVEGLITVEGIDANFAYTGTIEKLTWPAE